MDLPLEDINLQHLFREENEGSTLMSEINNEFMDIKDKKVQASLSFYNIFKVLYLIDP